MAESNTFPFQLRLYQNKLPEVIVDQPITENHKLFPSLITLMQKFPVVFLELKYPGKLTISSKEFFQKLENPEKLIVIIERSNQIEFDLAPIPVLPTIQSALLRLKHKPGIETSIKQIMSLPEMRSPVFEYLELLQDETLSFDEIVKSLETNIKLSNQILKICNSMEKFINNPFIELSRAISFVGVEGIRQILIEEAFTILTRIFSNQREKLCHMRRASTLAGMLGNLFGTNPHIFWRMRSAALMHDIGSLIISFYNQSESQRCINFSKIKNVTVCDVENIILGYNHQEAGLYFAKMMHLPEYLYPSIKNHHNNQIDKKDILLNATVIANGYINHYSEKIGYTDYEESIDNLEEAKKLAEKEKQDKEFAKLLSKIDKNDPEAVKKLENEFYNSNNEAEEELTEFKSQTRKTTFDSYYIEEMFKEKLALILKDGYELKMF